MAALTYTATDTVNPPRLNHSGVTTVVARYTHGGATSLSASDLIYMVRVPNKVQILDGYITGTCGGDATVWDVGVSSQGTFTDNNLGAALTLSETSALKRFNGISLPVKISLTDDASPLSTWVILTRTSGTSTATASIVLTLSYAPLNVVNS